jgi:hypothetical protein
MTIPGMADTHATGTDWRWSVPLPDRHGAGGRGNPAPGLGQVSPGTTSPRVRFAPAPRDVLAQCPKCKTMETLQFVGSTLLRCRKFQQKDGRIYHDCGSDMPCRLHA